MREILFRGKRMDNGDWVGGCLIESQFISPYQNGELYFNGTYVNGKSVDGIVWGQGSFYRIAPSTVGQYTGLKDKNGKRIFEGDIVRYTERRFGGKDVPVVHQVTFDEGGFCVYHYFLNNWLRNGLGGNTKLEDIEVIGNIHDNPELMKDEK